MDTVTIMLCELRVIDQIVNPRQTLLPEAEGMIIFITPIVIRLLTIFMFLL